MAATHEVLNQPPPLEGVNLFTSDRALTEALEREGGGWARDRAVTVGALAGGEARVWGEQANTYPPVLRTHDRWGHRIDEVEYHPAYHNLMRAGVAHGLHALPWREPRAGAQVARAALFFLMAQAEAGFGCPMSMTYAGVPALRVQPDVAAEWEPRFTSLAYDPRPRPAPEKQGAICGMAMTEKQGGSDVRTNTTRAVPAGSRRGPGAEYLLTGHKWFCSAPMCDAFLMLANTERGLTCFFVPRWRPDGTRNPIHLQRLKDKLGNKANASGEIEFEDAWARMIGDEGRGVRTIIEMVNHTRLDCVIGTAAAMRSAVAQTAHHAAHRTAFGRRLAEQPLMQNVLADLCVESEAATAVMMRLARAYDAAAAGDAAEGHFARLATAVGKYWVCKRGPAVVGEALECFGGSGYVEESPMARLYRDVPVNSIWEGSGNVIALDVLRVMGREPEAVPAFFGEVRRAQGGDHRLDALVDALERELGDVAAIEVRARRIVERMATALAGSLLVRHGDPAVADAFCAARVGRDAGLAFGTLPPGTEFARILERARPQVG